jgi:hypothetical protein
MIEIKYQVDFADYIRLMFQIAYRRWTYIIITLLGVIQLPLIAALFIIPSLYNPNSLTSSIIAHGRITLATTLYSKKHALLSIAIG